MDTAPQTISSEGLKKAQKLPKSLVVIFILMQSFFGVNFGFFPVLKKNSRALIRVTSVFTVTFVFTTDFIKLNKVQDWVGMVSYAVYMFILIMLFFSNYTFYNFLTDLMKIDEKLNIITKDDCVGLLISLYLIVSTCYKMFKIYFICSNYSLLLECSFLATAGSLIHFIVYFLPIVNALMFYNVYLRLKALKIAFKVGNVQVKGATMIYKSLADCLAKIRASQDYIIVLTYVTDFTRLVISNYSRLYYLKQTNAFHASLMIIFAISLLNKISLICLPVMTAEMVAREVGKMKLIIHERLLTERDDKAATELICFLQYVEARHLLREAWRLVPVDLQKLVVLFNMAITYIIVLLQLSHVY